MLKTSHNECPRADEILSYMYGEIVGAAEAEFEKHLTDCGLCTDEFAAVSNSRFSVYEWKKEAFDPLVTPEIRIPIGLSAAESPPGLAAGVRAWLGSLSLPVFAAAAVAVCIGLGIVVFSLRGPERQPTVSRVDTPAVPVGIDTGAPKPTVAPTPELVETGPPSSKPMPVRASATQPRRTAKRRAPVNNALTSTVVVTPKRIQLENAPALTALHENDDNSLRLADLFDEVGG